MESTNPQKATNHQERPSLFQRIKGLDSKFSWSFFGFFFGLLLGVPSLYLSYHEKAAAITLDVTSESNVLDIHRPVTELTISFRGEDIQKKDLNLQILSVRITNTGEVNILQPDFDQAMPWGLRVVGADIIGASVTAASSEYLQQSVATGLHRDANSLIFPKPILERGGWFVVELLLLHVRSTPPALEAFGKIAGVPQLAITRSWAKSATPTFFSRVVAGGIAVNLARIALGTIIGLTALILFFVMIAAVSDIFDQRRLRRDQARRDVAWAASVRLDHPAMGHARALFVRFGPSALADALEIIQDESQLSFETGVQEAQASMSAKLDALRTKYPDAHRRREMRQERHYLEIGARPYGSGPRVRPRSFQAVRAHFIASALDRTDSAHPKAAPSVVAALAPLVDQFRAEIEMERKMDILRMPSLHPDDTSPQIE